MAKKILTFFLLTAMFFSVIFMSSCKEEEKPEESQEPQASILTPKERFQKTGHNASNYFIGLAQALGMDPTLTPVTDGKMESESLSLTFNKLSTYGYQVFKEPFTISAESVSDFKNNAYKGLVQLDTFGDKVPVEIILTSGAVYLGIDKVTDRMLKIPVDADLPAAGNSSATGKIDYDEYLNSFINSFSEDQFTAQTGRVTVDGMELDAETVTLTSSAKQFGEAVVKLLEKAKTDLAISDALSSYLGTDADTSLDEILDEIIEQLNEEIGNSSDSDQIIITVISENNVLRSFDYTGMKNGKKNTISFTTTEKDGAFTVKGAATTDEKEIFNLSYEQRPNDKNSADGELMLNFDQTDLFYYDITEENEEDSSNYNTMGLKLKFSGQKTDNRFSVNTKLEVIIGMSGVKIIVPINVAYEFEKISDSELKYSLNLSLNAMNTEFEVTISGGRKIIDYSPVTVPSDSEVDAFNEEMLEEIGKKVVEVYPGIGEFINSLGNNTFDPENSEMYFAEDGSFLILLDSECTGYLSTSLYDVKYKDGKYSARLPDGTKINGVYTQNGDKYTIDGVPFLLQEVDGYKYLILDTENVNSQETSICLDEEECKFLVNFAYTIEGETLTLTLETGAKKTLTFVKDGDSYTINGVKVTDNLSIE